MKHTPKITIYLLCLFVLAQIIGVGVLNAYIDPVASDEAGKTTFSNIEIAGVSVEPPPVEEDYSFVYIAIAILVGTVLIFLIMHFQADFIWKFWFFAATVLTLSISFAAFIPSMIGFGIALVIAAIRVYRPHIIAHNISELFTYGGLAAIFVPVMNLTSALALLLFISLYDMYAVWKSKHMVKLATYQTNSKLFAGLMLPYNKKGIVTNTKSLGKLVTKKKPVTEKTVHSAILGGGDIGFPLFFIGVVLKMYGLTQALLIIPFVTAALGILFWYSEGGKFYPAMPVVSAGCLVGFQIVTLFL